MCSVAHTDLADSLRTFLCLTPCNRWAVTHQAPLPMGMLQVRILERVACTPPGDLPNPGMEPRSPALQADSLLAKPQGGRPINLDPDLTSKLL